MDKHQQTLDNTLQKIAEDHWEWVGAIETYSGVRANIIDLQDNQIHLEDIAVSLGNICRYNGHLPKFYSVAEHSCHVANWLDTNGYDRKTILTGLLHDASEAYVGDMVRPLKRHPEFGAYHQKIEEQIAQKISAKYGAHYPYPDAIHEADKEIYIWEVKQVRTGQHTGLRPNDATELFLETYEQYKDTAS